LIVLAGNLRDHVVLRRRNEHRDARIDGEHRGRRRGTVQKLATVDVGRRCVRDVL
jgi:hypothetical protein